MSPSDHQLATLYSEVGIKNDYTNDLENVVIRLPITSATEDDATTTDPKASFDSQLASTGGLVDFNQAIDQISYRLLNDSKTVVLTPIVLNNNFGVKYHKFILKLPDVVLSSCLSCLKLDDITFILDILTKEGLFITLSFQLEDFTSNSSITLNNFEKWGKYDMPYSIESRKPHSISTLSENLTVVPFIDGGLLQLRRKSKFDQIETITFTDSSYFDSLTKFFKKSPGNEYIDNKISVRTVISSALLNDNYLITLSINRKLRIWSFETNTVILEQDLVSSETYFDARPSSLIKIIDSPSTNEFRLITLVPLEEKKLIVWTLAISTDQCLLQEDFIINFPVIDEANWISQAFQIYKVSDDHLKIAVLSRSNTLEKILICDAFLKTNEFSWTNTNSKFISDKPELVNNLHYPESINEYYLTKLATQYNSIILNTVLSIFENHYNHSGNPGSLLNQRIVDVVSFNLDPESFEYLKDLKNQWAKFDGSCKELLKQCLEPIGLAYSERNETVYVLKSYGISVYKESSFIELLSQNTHSHLSNEILKISHPSIDSTALSKLFLLAADFKSLFNEDVIEELKYNLTQIDVTDFNSDDIEASMGTAFNEHLSPYLTEDLVSQLLTRLGSIPNVLEVIDVVSSDIGGASKFISDKLSIFGYSLLVESLRNVLSLYEDFNLGLIMIMLVIDNNAQVRNLFSKIGRNFKSITLVSKVLDIPDENIFANVIYKQFQVKGFKLKDSNTLNDIISSILSYASSSDSFLINSVVQLISIGKSHEIFKYGIDGFLTDHPIHIFVKGITYLKTLDDDKAFKILTSNASQIVDYQLSPRESSDLDLLSSLSLVFGSSLMRYYIILTDAFNEGNHIKNAYNLAKLALKNHDSDADEDLKDSDIVHWNLFQLSLKLSDYDNSFKTINNLSPSLKLKSIKIFVLHLLDTKSISTLLHFNFKENISVVDSIILELAMQQDFLINSLNYFKILYSWRLSFNDKRGAAEALYQFIDKFENNKHQFTDFSIELRPLYIIILNVIRTIAEKEDQWIIRKVENGENVVITFDELEKEYHNRF